ncbi:MAG: protein kinase [Myxococcota bacterium]
MTEPTPLPSDLNSGRRFELHERVGAGAFGEVYLATQRSTAGFNRKVALKVLHPSRFGEDDAARRIRDEARMLSALHHPHIVTVLDLVRLQGQWAVVMEYVEGADIERVAQALERTGRVFPPKAALEMMANIADALDAAHNAESGSGRPLRLVHRDIKPANIRLTPNGEVKILDFGIARSRTQREAETGAYIIGTQRYMAPERITAVGDGPEGDVYSLAATAVEMLTGSALGRTPVLAARHHEFITAKLKTLRMHVRGRPDIVRRVAGLMSECLAHHALERPRAADLATQARELARSLPGEDLRAFSRRFMPQVDTVLGHKPDRVTGVLAEHTGRDLPDTLRTSTNPGVDPVGPAEEAEEPARRRWGWLFGALAAITVIGLGGALILLLAAGGAGAFWWLNQPVSDSSGTLTEEQTPAGGSPHDSPSAPAVDDPSATDGIAPPVEDPADPAGAASTAATDRAESPPATANTETEPVPMKKVSRALFSVSGASSIRAICGNISATGTATTRMMSFPAGTCRVYAIVGNVEYRGSVDVSSPRTVRCALESGALVCD